MNHLIANYHEHRATMRALADELSEHRAIFLEGSRNYGKTWLLKWLRRELAGQVPLVVIDLADQSELYSPLTILRQIITDVERQQFPRLSGKLAQILHKRLEQSRVATIQNVNITGDNANFNSSTGETDEDRLAVAFDLTDMFLEDLTELPKRLQPLILAVDGFDEATPLVRAWLARSFVKSFCAIRHTRLTMCGRTIPENDVKLKAGPSALIELNGVRDPRDWVDVATALNIPLPGDPFDVPSLNYLKGVVDAFGGVPGSIMPWLLSKSLSDGR